MASPQNLTPQAFPGLELGAREKVIAVLVIDLDAELRYRSGTLVLTNTRIASHSAAPGEWKSFPLSPGVSLVRHDHAGLLELSLQEGANQLERWYYTLAAAPAAIAFCDAFAALSRDSVRISRPQLPSPADDSDDEGATPASGTGPRPLVRLMQQFAGPHVSAVASGLLLALVSTAAGLIPPYLTMPLVDKVLVPGYQATSAHAIEPLYHEVVKYLGGLLLAALLAWLLAWAQSAVLSFTTERIAADLRNRTFSHLQRLSLEYFGGKRTGDLIARISSDTDHLCSFLSDTVVDFITDVLMISGTAAVLIYLDPLLGAAALLSFPLIAWLIVRIRGRLTQGFLRSGRVWSAMNNILADTIPGIRVVKAFSQESREIERFARANERIVEVNNRINALWTFFWPLVALLNQIGLLVVWGVGAWQVLHHRISVGVLTAFIAYVSRFYTRVESMSRMLTATQKASAGAQRLFEILDRVPSVIEAKDPLPLEHVAGAISFERVSFRYGSRLVLDDVSFTIEPGQMVGIVGHTGSGKSTVSNLICRFYDASAGAVRVDGVDVRRVALEQYRRHIGIVLQEPFLFFGTIGDNVAYGAPDADGARVLEAARAARAHEFVLKLPEAYDSLVGERGQSLSGGERQRIAIARAILVDPRILILDEATSAVDTQTEREIQRALDNVVAGRTTVAIAHRLSTLRKADKLIVLKDGHVAEMGTHAELLALDGEYARLSRAQATQPGSELNEPDFPEEEEVGDLRIPTRELELSWQDGKLQARRRGQSESVVVFARRCFPLTEPDRWICLVGPARHERACIASLEELDERSRGALEQALYYSEFLPEVQRIEHVVHEATRSEWHVETGRGSRVFVVEQEDHIRRLEDGRHVITDRHGMRYLIPSPERLDVHSRRWLSRFS